MQASRVQRTVSPSLFRHTTGGLRCRPWHKKAACATVVLSTIPTEEATLPSGTPVASQLDLLLSLTLFFFAGREQVSGGTCICYFCRIQQRQCAAPLSRCGRGRQALPPVRSSQHTAQGLAMLLQLLARVQYCNPDVDYKRKYFTKLKETRNRLGTFTAVGTGARAVAAAPSNFPCTDTKTLCMCHPRWGISHCVGTWQRLSRLCNTNTGTAPSVGERVAGTATAAVVVERLLPLSLFIPPDLNVVRAAGSKSRPRSLRAVPWRWAPEGSPPAPRRRRGRVRARARTSWCATTRGHRCRHGRSWACWGRSTGRW